jgi:hypothetical protein
MTNEPVEHELYELQYFHSPVYSIVKPEFLDPVRTLAAEYIADIKKTTQLSEVNPSYQSGNMADNSSLAKFTSFIKTTAWHILKSQGFKMEDYETTLPELWAQEHYKYSGQEQHTHSHMQISGFYFLDGHADAPKLLIHDPRQAKQYFSLPQTDVESITHASDTVNFSPTAGTMVFINSWLSHSIARNEVNTPFRFLHFSVGVSKKSMNNGPIIV